MNAGIILDIYPNKWKSTNIEGKNNHEWYYSAEYNSYKYNKSGVPFTVSSLLHNEKPLSGIILSDAQVTDITTYFKNQIDSVQLIYITTTKNQTVCINPYVKTKLQENTILTKFLPSVPLSNDDIREVLSNIDEYSGLDLVVLNRQKGSVARKLFNNDDVIFDLTNTPKESSGYGSLKQYRSAISNTTITLKLDTSSVDEYIRVKHEPSVRNFKVRGIQLPNKQSMQLDGGFPQEHMINFFAYYKKSDIRYNDVLLITFMDPNEGDEYSDSDSYLLSKNQDTGKFDMFRVKGTIYDESELPNILSNISTSNKLNTEKLDTPLKDKVEKISPDLPQVESQETTRGQQEQQEEEDHQNQTQQQVQVQQDRGPSSGPGWEIVGYILAAIIGIYALFETYALIFNKRISLILKLVTRLIARL